MQLHIQIELPSRSPNEPPGTELAMKTFSTEWNNSFLTMDRLQKLYWLTNRNISLNRIILIKQNNDTCCFVFQRLFLCYVDEAKKTISLEELILGLTAGGLTADQKEQTLKVLGRTAALDFLDFLTYIPLFIHIHDHILQDPLGTVVYRDMLAVQMCFSWRNLRRRTREFSDCCCPIRKRCIMRTSRGDIISDNFQCLASNPVPRSFHSSNLRENIWVRDQFGAKRIHGSDFRLAKIWKSGKV